MATPPPSSSRYYTPTKAQHLHYLSQTISLAKLSPPKPTNFRVGCVLVSYPSSSPSSSDHTTTSSTTSTPPDPKILSTGYTLELPGNTHAEQNALSKLVLSSSSSSSAAQEEEKEKAEEEKLNLALPESANVYLYTSLEPCGLRLSGNKPCVNRILDTRNKEVGPGYGIRKVVFGAKEPDTFVENSRSCRLLSEAGVEWEYIPDLEEEILRVAMEGHVKKREEQGQGQTQTQTQTSGDAGEMQSLHSRVDAMSADTMTKVDHEEERRRQEAEAHPRNPKKRMMEHLHQ